MPRCLSIHACLCGWRRRASLGQLWLQRRLDPQARCAEHVDEVGDGVAALGERDVVVPAAPVGEPRGGEVLLAQGGPVLFGLFDCVADRLRLGQQDEPVVREPGARCLQGADRVLRVAEGLQEQDPVEGAARHRRHGVQLVQVALDQLQPRCRSAREVATHIDPDASSRPVSDQLSELPSVAATEVEHRPSAHVTEQVALRGPLNEPIQRVLPVTGPLVVRSECRPGLARIAGRVRRS